MAATSFGEVSGGDGALAHITFEVVAYKESTLLLNTVKLLDNESKALPVTVEDGEVILLYGDVNNDGVVSIQDLVLVANSFGRIGQTSADINKDGVIDITDLVLVAGAMKLCLQDLLYISISWTCSQSQIFAIGWPKPINFTSVMPDIKMGFWY